MIVLDDSELPSLVEQYREITEQIKFLTDQKSNLGKAILAKVDVTRVGTETYTNDNGSPLFKVSVSEAIEVDSRKIMANLKALDKLGLMDTVVKPDFKIDKRAYESLPVEKQLPLKESLSYKLKPATLTLS